MFFDTIEQRMNFIMRESALNMDKATAKMAMALEASAIKRDEIALKYTTEGATYDDMCLFNEEVEEGVLKTFKEAVIKLIETIKKFFRDIKDKVVALFTEKKIDAQIAAAEKKVKLHPVLKNFKKISVPVESKATEEDKKLHGKMLAFVAKIKGGATVTADEVNSVGDEHKTKVQHALMTSAKVVTIAVALGAAAIAAKTLLKDIKEREAWDDDVQVKASAVIPSSNEDKNALLAVIRNMHSAIADACQRLISYPGSILAQVKSAIGGSKGEVEANAANVKASKDYKIKEALFKPRGKVMNDGDYLDAASVQEDYSDDMFSEGYDDSDLDDYFNESEDLELMSTDDYDYLTESDSPLDDMYGIGDEHDEDNIFTHTHTHCHVDDDGNRYCHSHPHHHHFDDDDENDHDDDDLDSLLDDDAQYHPNDSSYSHAHDHDGLSLDSLDITESGLDDDLFDESDEETTCESFDDSAFLDLGLELDPTFDI